jgi:hypothetical protein
MHYGTRALTAPDHAEVGLESIQIGKENDACLVVPGGSREDVAGERYGGREQFPVAGNIAGIERAESQGCGGAMASNIPSNASL